MMKNTASGALGAGFCRVRFGCPATAVAAEGGAPSLNVALPVLAGPAEEWLLGQAAEPARAGEWTLFRNGSGAAGIAVAGKSTDLEDAAVGLYRSLFAVSAGLHLHRIWNYVPAINESQGGLENYRRFCRGRSLAFEERFGPGFQQLLPASSAVGTAAGPLAVGFVAGAEPPRCCENPKQVPAFNYPPQYGPRSPSFSRATAVGANGERRVYISGTAAIRGHVTVAPQDLEGQLACTLENLRLIAAEAGGGLDRPGGRRHFKVYIRRSDDFQRVSSYLASGLLNPGDAVSYLQADLCRADLLVEIEAILDGPN